MKQVLETLSNEVVQLNQSEVMELFCCIRNLIAGELEIRANKMQCELNETTDNLKAIRSFVQENSLICPNP